MKTGPNAVHMGEEGFISLDFGKPALVDAAEHQPRIVVGLLPEIGVETAEEFDGWMMPGPAEVECEIVEAAQALREAG